MTPVYKTLTGFHFLGMTETLASLRALFADGHIPAVAKFVQCDASYIASLENAFPADTLIIARWKYYDGQRWDDDKIDNWLAAYPNVATAALAWADMLRGELASLAAIPRTVYVELFNEPEVSQRLCEFNVHAAKILHARYGAEVKLAALSLGSGRYNGLEQWALITEHLIDPLNNAGIDFAIALHGYSSLAMPVWNDPRYGFPDIQRIFASGNPAVEIDLDAVPRVSLNAKPNSYTGFAHEDAGFFLKQIRPGLEGTPLLLTETGIDDARDPGMGASAGGFREWARRRLWDRVLRVNESIESYMSRNLVYAERRYAAFNKAGGNIIGATPFTYSDANPNSRWYLDYRVIGETWELFKAKMKAINIIDAPIPEEETMPTGIKLYWPVEDTKRAFNQAYGANVPYYSQFGLNGHEGVDLYAPHGTKIFACAEGTVSVVNMLGLPGYRENNYGNNIRIRHADGFETIYAHLHEVKVNAGDTVKASQVIGLADNTGNSSGSHLHLTLKLNGVIINPTAYLVREFATSTTPPEPITGCRVRATTNLNIRKDSDTAAEKLGMLNGGSSLKGVAYALKRDGKTWYKVEYGTHPHAWVHGDFVTLESCTDLPRWIIDEPIPEPEPEPTPEPEPVPIDPRIEMMIRIQPILKRMMPLMVAFEDDFQEIIEIAEAMLPE